MSKKHHLITGVALAAMLALPLATNAQVIKSKAPLRKRAPITHVVKKTVTKKIVKTTINPVAAKPGIRNALAKNTIAGTVASISGTTLTVTGTNGTTYTVDASSAKMMEANSGLSISNIQIGDKVMAMGIITGTNVAAKSLNDQSFEGRNVFSGSVTAISGTTLTISSRNKTTYSVDASSATVTTGMGTSATASSVGAIKVGDRITAMGSLSGSNVTATSVRDMGQFKAGQRGAGKGFGNWGK